jgi:hypothetical protein
MPKVKIYVEGVADAKFIQDFINHHYGVTLTIKTIEDKSHFTHGQIIDLKGKDKLLGEKELAKLKPPFQMYNDDGGQNIVILDADEPINGGSFSVRQKELQTVKDGGLPFEFFLLPNHKDDGDLETLLVQIINQDNQEIFNCWNGYESCLTHISIKGRGPLTTPARKTKIYAYLEALLGVTKDEKKKIKEKEREYQNPAHWNLNADALQPLKDFFDQFEDKIKA